jgi:High-affinity K+ transport system, ATPase chain B
MTRLQEPQMAVKREDSASLSASGSPSLFQSRIVVPALYDSVRKLDPRVQMRNPVMFIVELGSLLTTIIFVVGLLSPAASESSPWFVFFISVWLWFTVLFANFAESMAEGRGKAQAASLRQARKDVSAKKLKKEKSRAFELVSSSTLRERGFCPG